MIKDLSIIIVSYNTASITLSCLKRIFSSLKKNKNLSFEIIVVDNGSTDNSVKKIEKLKLKELNLTIIKNKRNLGYAKANNQGLKDAKGNFILFLNSDVLVEKIDWIKLFDFFRKNKNIGALTVKIKLKNGKIDWASHRGFPTLWRSVCYFFRLEKFFASIPLLNKIFGGYHLTHLNLDKVHEVEAISGAFFLTKKSILDKLKGFDEQFFMYGEDLDLCLRIKKLGYQIIYYPHFSVVHLKYQSGLGKDNKAIKRQTRYYFYQAMKIFYKKHYEKKYPFFINSLVYFFLDWKIKRL